MSGNTIQGSFDPAHISIDPSGRVVIDNPILSEAIRKQLAGGRGAAEVAARRSSSVNIIACGNHCSKLTADEVERTR